MKLYNFNTVEQLASSLKTLISKNFVGSTRLTSSGFMNIGTQSQLTISGGEITVTKTHHYIDTESSATADDLNTINGGEEGDIIILRSTNADRIVTLKDNVDNLRLAGDCALDATADTITLMQLSNGAWVEICRSNNA